MPKPLEFDIGVQCTSTIDSDGFEDVQYDAEGEGQSGASPMERHHMYGFWGRAMDPAVIPAAPGQPATGQPDPSKGAQLLYAFEGSQAHGWTLEDPRVMAVVPTPDPGNGIMYGVNPTAGANGDLLGVCFVRTYPSGKVARATTSTGGGRDGQTIWDEVNRNGFVRACPWGREIFGVQGPPGGPAVFTGYSLQVIGGSTMTFSVVGGLPPGLPSSGIAFNSGRFSVTASAVSIGAVGSTPLPVAQVPPLLTLLQSLQTALDAVGAALAGLQAGSSSPQASAAPVAAAGVAIGLAQAAIGAAAPIIGTKAAIG